MQGVIRPDDQSYLETFPLSGPHAIGPLPHNGRMARRPYNQALHDELLLLRRERVDRGLSIEEVAEAVGLSKQQMQRMETGTRNINLKWLLKLADFYGLPLARLVRGGDGLSDNERDLITFMRQNPKDARILMSAFDAMRDAPRDGKDEAA